MINTMRLGKYSEYFNGYAAFSPYDEKTMNMRIEWI